MASIYSMNLAIRTILACIHTDMKTERQAGRYVSSHTDLLWQSIHAKTDLYTVYSGWVGLHMDSCWGHI